MSHISRAKAGRSQTRLLPEEDPEFQIAPMIDILLVLLVFFMSITSTEVLQTNDAVRLPVAKDGKEPRKDTDSGQVIVNVLWTAMNNSGSFNVDERTYTEAAAIRPILEAQVAKSPDMRVLIRADKEVRYEFLKSLLTVIGSANVSNVTFSVVDKEGADAPGPTAP